MRVLIFDTETGGLDPRKHSVLSVGVVIGDLDTGEILETYEAYNRLDSIDDYVVNPGSIEVHGITPAEAFANGVPTQEIQERFADLYTKYNITHIGGHNVPYDIEMMAFKVFGFDSTAEFRANFGYRILDSSPITRLTSGMEEVKSGATVAQVIKALKIDMTDYGKNKYHAA
jgi:DNA polymerase-3 subunit epsilon